MRGVKHGHGEHVLTRSISLTYPHKRPHCREQDQHKRAWVLRPSDERAELCEVLLYLAQRGCKEIRGRYDSRGDVSKELLFDYKATHLDGNELPLPLT